MKELIRQTTAYAIFSGDKRSGKLSHSYLLRLDDEIYLRSVLLIFAKVFFGDENISRRIDSGSFTDLTVYPAPDEKITADGISRIIADSALRPVEGKKKLYVICGFENASPVVQNKLLKTLEEPLEGVHFLLGATTTAPVLGTVLSRVKLLEIPPFGERQIFDALERMGKNPLNAAAAKSSGGSLGAAQTAVNGGWFKEIADGAREICSVKSIRDIAAVAQKYGDTKYKKQLLAEIQRQLFANLTKPDAQKAKLIYMLELVDAASADLKFNAYFQGLLYDFMLKSVNFKQV